MDKVFIRDIKLLSITLTRLSQTYFRRKMELNMFSAKHVLLVIITLNVVGLAFSPQLADQQQLPSTLPAQSKIASEEENIRI